MTTIEILKGAQSAIEADARLGRHRFTESQAKARSHAAIRLRMLIATMEAETQSTVKDVAEEFTFPRAADAHGKRFTSMVVG